MLGTEDRISSINTFATTCSCVALFSNSSGEPTLVGSSSRLTSLAAVMSLSTTFCKVDLR